MRLMQPDGRVGHAQLRIGSAGIMLADEFPEYGNVGPAHPRGHPRLAAPGRARRRCHRRGRGRGRRTVEREVSLEFYGSRSGTIIDPFGHRWNVQTPVEDVPVEELQRRLDALSAED